MKTIKLTQGYITQVDDFDYDYLSQFKWRAQVIKGMVYAVRSYAAGPGRQKLSYMHRELLGLVGTERRVLVDHRDGDGLNNQRENIRVADHTKNALNAKRTNAIRLLKELGITIPAELLDHPKF